MAKRGGERAATELIWQWEDPKGHVVPPDSKAMNFYRLRSGRLVKAYAPPAPIELHERPVPKAPFAPPPAINGDAGAQ